MTEPSPPPRTIEARLRAALPDLTRAERQLAAYMLNSYPVAVLGSIASVARGAGVSAPTVGRLLQKLGFTGYPEFQAQLREEVGERLASPLAKHEKWAQTAPDAHVLDSFAGRVVEDLTATLGQIDRAGFDTVAGLLADADRRITLIGGRLTQAIAGYFQTALRIMRDDVVLLSAVPSTWPPVLLDMRPGDVLVAFDIRRYEPPVQQFVELARARDAQVVLITDRWVSPAAAHAQHLMPCHIEAPSAWDTLTAPLMLVEALLTAVQRRDRPGTLARLEKLEIMYEDARIFRRSRQG
ncbi:MurR/RpiR family transcriptional regulator [Pararhodobacter sp. SW119]|uniref:MurR/RpiR family transcriptional regulator n=1 Tax=Pararhodobacter sp. SW119 TaxID=2780075 RepID=UPI001AE01C20|nr:MurR/RpiR family transcriptional regulator [Pararhodobacter sp. SW119]